MTIPIQHSEPPAPAVPHNWRAALDRMEGAYSPHTLRGYRSDFASFEVWCDAAAAKALSALPETIASYLDALSRTHRPATLRRRLAAIGKVHRLCRLADPTRDEDVVLAFRRARRQRPGRPAQALGLNSALRETMLSASATDLCGLRDRAMMAVGYDTLCRRSELVALRAEDLERRASGGANILVRRAKSDPNGNGRIAALSANALHVLEAWLHAAAITRGPIFRPVYRDTILPRSLHPGAVSRVLKAGALRAHLAPQVVAGLSGHSMRVGCAQDLNLKGHDLLTIMRAGGWRSVNVVARYLEKVDLRIWD